MEGFSMSEYEILELDPWLNSSRDALEIPTDAVFLCAYECWVEIDSIVEAAFLRRLPDRDELWLLIAPSQALLSELSLGWAGRRADRASCMKLGCAVAGAPSSDESTAARRLLEALFRSRVGYGFPTDFQVGGSVEASTYEQIVADLKNELDSNADAARENESGDASEIVETARELHLNPRPTGTGPHHWLACCPETSHSLYIQSQSNEFGCGYCKRKGGPDELRAFVADRNARSSRVSPDSS
jgi:hypothetical protein